MSVVYDMLGQPAIGTVLNVRKRLPFGHLAVGTFTVLSVDALADRLGGQVAVAPMFQAVLGAGGVAFPVTIESRGRHITVVWNSVECGFAIEAQTGGGYRARPDWDMDGDHYDVTRANGVTKIKGSATFFPNLRIA